MKYMGSKSRIAKNIVPILNNIINENNIKTYIEPFCGGCNIIDKIICNEKIASDNNKYLIDMWIALQNGWLPPISLSKELYNDVKNNKEKYPNELVSIAGLCATYNAKWFGGYAGIVNTKIGTQRNYYDESIRNIMQQIKSLIDVKFLSEDYTYFEKYNNCLIYNDPPYYKTTQYGTSKNFNHDEFWNWVRRMSLNNIVLTSEYNAPNDFVSIFTKQLTTTLDKNSRKIDVENLFIHQSTIDKIMNKGGNKNNG